MAPDRNEGATEGEDNAEREMIDSSVVWGSLEDGFKIWRQS